jgi:uncharacterized protein
MIFLTDRAEIKGSVRITRDGYLVADALVAKANNIQEYRAGELDLADRDPNSIVRIFRPANVVFDKDAMASLAHRPITLDHPSEPVTSANWKRLAVGDVGDEVLRDGERVRVPIKVMDAAAVDSIATDRQEFSLGYAATMDMKPGEHEGQAYDGALTSVRYNHLAACKCARGGSELRIVDERPEEDRRKTDDGSPINSDPTDAKPGGVAKMPHTLMIDGFQITDVSDSAKAAIEKLQGQVKDAGEATAKLTADLATANTTIQTRDGEIVALKKQVEDAAITPAKLQALADARAKVIEQAKKLDPNVVTDGKTDAEIRRAAVNTKLGDAAKDMADAAVDGAFAALIAAAPAGTTDNLRSTLAAGHPNAVGDAKVDYDKAMEDRKKQLSDAWKPEPAKAA